MPEGKSEIPADILAAAEEVLDNMLCNCREAFDSDDGQRKAMIDDIAQAVLAERERCVNVALAEYERRFDNREEYPAVRVHDFIVVAKAIEKGIRNPSPSTEER